jgi:methionyl-tRNA synthetase
MELKINSELANNIGNFINRAMKFSASKFPEGMKADKFAAFFESHAKDVEVFIKDYHELLDSYQIKRGQEHIMGLGSKVNQFITERAPWTEFKTDPEKAAETIAISTAYVIVIGTFFAPYLPQLSQSILSYFGLNAESELVKKIYQGDMKALKDFFATDFKLHVDPQGLVPKIDPKVIEELDKKLKEKAQV